MATTGADACLWPMDSSCCCPEWDDTDACLKIEAHTWASEILWALSGRVFQACPVTIRPCRRHTACCPSCPSSGPWSWTPWDGWATAPWRPVLHGGQWFNLTCPCGDPCACGRTLDKLTLPDVEIAEVREIRIDGMPFTDWVLIDAATLARTDGETWPVCQDLAEPDTAEGTWSITYVPGRPVPPAGRRAVALLACEIARACQGRACLIPQAGRLTSASRDGVSWEFDPTALYESGLTGVPDVDLWLRAVNPDGLRRPSGVYTPDRCQTRVTTPRQWGTRP